MPGFGVPGEPVAPVTHVQAVAWGELDAFGHVNHTVFLRWLENVRIAWFEHVGIMALRHETHGRISPILAKVTCEYRAPVGFPDTILTSIECVELGTSSLKLRSRIGSLAKQQVVAEAEVVIVLIEVPSEGAAELGRATPVPEPIRAAIRALDGAVLQERGRT